MNKPKKILIVRTDRLGDLILSTPVIANLRKAYPQTHIAFICRPYTKQVLEGNPYLDEIIVYDKYGKHKSLGASIEFAFCLSRKKFDWAIVLHPTNRTHFITFLAGIPLRIGWNRKMGFLLNKKIPHNKQQGKKHELEYTLSILRELNIPITDKKTHFPIKQESEEKIGKILEDKVFLGEKLVVIHPCASCPSKRWPHDSFLKLISLLKAQNIKVAIISSESEKELGRKMAEEKGIIDLRAKLNLSQTASLIKRADLFISNDSGPVHIAAALNKPVISIFGRKDPGLSPLRWKPLGEKSFYIHKDAGCAKCLAHNCQKGFLCLKMIKPEEIYSLARQIIGHGDS
ncbi:MAG: lipopolysaccharide heptosyltransferase II [Candidatus Omnitrophota bacterium]